MVAASRQLPAAVIFDPFDRLTGAAIVRFTVSDVQAMLRQQIIPEDSSTELLDGLVLRKDRAPTGEGIAVHGTRHSLSVALLAQLAPRIDTTFRHGRSQLPILCDEMNAPEPDFAIVRGVARDYSEKLPAASDVFVVIEVADSSLERDSDRKLAIYARSAVPEYLILNLRNDTVEHYTSPDTESAAYRTKVTLARGEMIKLPLGRGEELSLPVGDLLP